MAGGGEPVKSARDIKALLFVGYAVGYLMAVFGPVVLDPLLKSHVLFSARTYPHAFLCIPIYVIMLGTQLLIFRLITTLTKLYTSVIVFLAAICVSLPIFLPEFPHGNVLFVGIMTTFLSSFAIFVWSISNQIAINPRALGSAGVATLEYLKALFAFVRQGAFAGVALFGALFFAAYTTGFKFVEAVVTDKSDLFLLNSNVGVQIALYAIYCIVGPIRYFFSTSLRILIQFREIAEQLDQKPLRGRPRKIRSAD